MRFERPEYLWLLWGIIPMALFFYVYVKRRHNFRKRIGGPALDLALPMQSKQIFIARFFLFLVVCMLFVIALANPQGGQKQIKRKTKGADIMICLDVSNSMLAEDFKPNRLFLAKRALQQLFLKCEGHRIGLIVFAGEAVKQFALTPDYNSAISFLEAISTDMLSKQGTHLSDALQLALESLPKGKAASSAVILITDGENHDAAALDICDNAVERHIPVHTIGIGTESGVPIPNFINGKASGYKLNAEGQVVISKLNLELLKSIALKTHAVCVKASPSDLGLSHIFSEIEKLEKTKNQNSQIDFYTNQYQTVLAFLTLFFLLDIFIEFKSAYRFRPFTLLVIVLFTFSVSHAQAPKYVYNGNKQFKLQNSFNAAGFNTVKSFYKDALKENPDYVPALYNLSYLQGLEYILQYTPQKAKDSVFTSLLQAPIQYLEALSKKTIHRDTMQSICHNLGTLYIYNKAYDKAIAQLRMALKINPRDENARYNLSFALKQKQKQQNGASQSQPKNIQNNSDKNQSQANKISEQQAEQILKALMQQEKSNQKPKSKITGTDEIDW